MALKTILHISADFPDDHNAHKTTAVSSLVQHLHGYRSVVCSINRVDGLCGEELVSFRNDVLCIRYNALPKGLFWKQRLQTLAGFILTTLQKHNITPHLIVAHKASIEGVVALKMSSSLQIPFVCCVQGNTDMTLFKIHVSLQHSFYEIFKQAARVFYYSAWPVDWIQKKYLPDPSKGIVLACAPPTLTAGTSKPCENPSFVCVFNYVSIKHKNIRRLLKAFKSIQPTHPCSLDIIGGGSEKHKKLLASWIEKEGLGTSVHMKGSVPNKDIPHLLQHYSALLLPSTHETFGLVYTEALFAGIPVLFSKGRGIDGFVDSNLLGYRCDPYSVKDIAQGIVHLITHEKALKEGIAQAHKDGIFDILTPQSIFNTFQKGLESVVPSHEKT